MSSVSLAFVDSTGNVTLVLNTDASLSDSFTSSAHIIDVTSMELQPVKGWTYDGTNFIAPPPIPEPVINPSENTTPPIVENPNPVDTSVQ
jgi:hypothetical protein